MMKRVLGALAALACVALVSSCSLLPDIPTPGNDDTGQKADVVMQDIADAVKHHDVAALKKLFSPGARVTSPRVVCFRFAGRGQWLKLRLR